MGSQWAPVMCSLVALQREHTYSILCDQAIFSGKLFSAFRYEDLIALHTIQEPAYHAYIPQIISMARSFGQKWTRQQLTPFDKKERLYPFCSLVHLVMS